MKTFTEIIQENRAYYCLDCGKCSSVCPITRHLIDPYTSPRLLVETALASGADPALEEPLLFSCLTCGRCGEVCPAEVDFPTLVREFRLLASKVGRSGSCTHSGMIQSWMRMMSDPGQQGNRLDWITTDLETDSGSDTIYFPGCLPYFEIAFKGLGFEGTEIACSAVRILNALGIAPQVLEEERCCGHDLYWQGDLETFRKLAELNLDAIARSGAKRIITTCPECAYTLRTTYREEIADPGLEILHLTEFLGQQEMTLPFQDRSEREAGRVTYQDPCRLGRFGGSYQEPRDLLAQMGTELIEMEHNREKGICCGSSCWTSCGQVNKGIQVERLREARSTQADLLITACPKCQIHLKCAQQGPNLTEEIDIPVRDITTILAEKLSTLPASRKGGRI